MFIPDTVFFQREALNYDTGRVIMDSVLRLPSVEVKVIDESKPRLGNTARALRRKYMDAKRTLLVAVRKTLSFQTCKPSAHYQLPLVTSCPGLCEYCYLQTTLGPNPYVTVYVNLEEIFLRTQRYINERQPEQTLFEASAVGDPVPVERYTGSLAKAVNFFASQQLGRMRVATKFDDLDTLVDLDHKGHTHFRFSVNAPSIVKKYERGAPGLKRRIAAAQRLATRGYPVGFIIAPVFTFTGWENEYSLLANMVRSELAGINGHKPITVEFISHRFTTRAKNIILSRHPETELPLDEKTRAIKRGQFGYIKYVYPDEKLNEIKKKISVIFSRQLPNATVEYFI